MTIICYTLLTLVIISISAHPENILSFGSSRLTSHSSNETVLISPTDESLARAISNGKILSDYLVPKNTDLMIKDGNWTMEDLQRNFPAVVERTLSEYKSNGFLIKKTIFVDKGAQLNIVNNNVFLESSSKKDNIPTALLTYGKTVILNSTVTSWDPQAKAADPNPYHPRPFVVAKDGGKMDIIGSSITNLGFSQGGIHSLFSSLAGINYYNTSNFLIANSTIAHNLYGFFSNGATNFKIIGNNIYDHTGYGLDPHTGSKNFIIDSNHIRLSGKQGIICSFRCKNVTITNNLVEYNMEGIGFHWLTNSSLIKNNVIKYNKNYGIFIKTHSTDNLIENNNVIGNGHGIGLFDSSNGNTIKSNILIGNILDPEGIHMDRESRSNVVKQNRISP